MANKMTGNNPNQNPANVPTDEKKAAAKRIADEKKAAAKRIADEKKAVALDKKESKKGYYIITSANGQPFTMKVKGKSLKEKMFKIKADKTEEIKKLKANGFLIVKKVK